MFRLVVLGLLAHTLVVSGFSDVSRLCIADNPGQTSNDFLLGTWYAVYEFIPSATIASRNCRETTYTRPTAAEIQTYYDAYSTAGFPFNIDENPVMLNQTRRPGLVTANSEAKFFLLDPSILVSQLWDGYEVNVYKRINENYILYWECAMRGQIRYLLARDRNAPQEEVLQVIGNIPEVRRMFARRMCLP